MIFGLCFYLFEFSRSPLSASARLGSSSNNNNSLEVPLLLRNFTGRLQGGCSNPTSQPAS